MEKRAQSYYANIHLAGDIETAKTICRKHCFDNGICVTVTPTTYIYTGGEESGVTVRLINYPKFPVSEDALNASAERLAGELILGMSQWSYSIETPKETVWFSRRPQ